MKYGHEAKIYFQIFHTDSGAPWPGPVYPGLCQAQISKDGGQFVNTTNAISTGQTNNLYTLVLTAQEMTCDSFVIAFIGAGVTAQPIIGETERDTTDKILGLAGHFSVSGDVLTAYNADGTTNAVYDLTRDQSGNITAIEPRSAQQ